MSTEVILCGGDGLLEPRGDCPNRLHDHPLPAGYVDSSEEAARRINHRWGHRRCPDCDLYGWEKP